MREKNINIGQVSGILTYPENIEHTSPLPAALLLHGFAADKNEVNGSFIRLAAELAGQAFERL